jgi:hypothetical protein
MNNRIILLLLFITVVTYDINKIKEEQSKFYEDNSPNEMLKLQKNGKSSERLLNAENNTLNLTIGKNERDFKINERYILDFSNITYDNTIEDLLIYTNLQDIQDNISQIDIFNEVNETSYPEKKITFISKGEKKQGFIDIEKVNKDEYVINKNIIRENFYKGAIRMNKTIEDAKFFVNIIPSDNNSDLYFFQTNRTSVRDDNKNRFKLYYFHDFGSKTLKEVINYIQDHPMKRERYINGKLEIFGYYYKDLDKDIYISKQYKQIKGTGILGPILSLSILSAALIVVVAFFIKNTYFDDQNKYK